MAGQCQLLARAQNRVALGIEFDQLSGVHFAFLGNAEETLLWLHLVRECPFHRLGRCCAGAGAGYRVARLMGWAAAGYGGGLAWAAGMAGQCQLLARFQGGSACGIEAHQFFCIHLAFAGNAVEAIPGLHLVG